MKQEDFDRRWPTLCNKPRCGAYCPDGWDGIVSKLCDLLTKEVGLKVTVDQIKEKFGGLRFYCSVESVEDVEEKPHVESPVEWAERIIKDVESMSFWVCQDCGTTNDVTTAGPGWCRTLCGSCRTTLTKGTE